MTSPVDEQRHPLSRQSMTHIVWQAGGSVMAIPSGADKIRAFHPALYIQDESAFLPEGEASLAAMMPTGARFICVSTAAPGWYETQCQR